MIVPTGDYVLKELVFVMKFGEESIVQKVTKNR